MRKILLAFLLLSITICLPLSAKSKVLAKVNGADVTLDDVKVILASNPNMKFEALPKDLRDKVISKAIDKELLTREASKTNINKTQEYKDALEVFKKNLIFNLWLKKEADSMKASKKEINNYYKENKQMFTQKASVKASHILLAEEAQAKDIIKKLKKSKNLEEDFAKMAKEKSTGPSGANGGGLGWFEKEKMVPSFSKAAFKLKKNSITKKPVKTQFGYHVIYVEDKKKGRVKKLSEVKKQVENSIKGKKFQGFIDKKTKVLRKKAKIKILD